jgi:hypothetical protein
MNAPSPHTSSKPLEVRCGRVKSVDLYEIKDSELDLLENGSPADIQLNFAIFLLSLAFSSIASLCTATFKSDIVQIVFILVAVVGILMGLYLLISWRRTRTSISKVVAAIRGRMDMPAEGVKPGAPPTSVPAPVKETEPAG